MFLFLFASQKYIFSFPFFFVFFGRWLVAHPKTFLKPLLSLYLYSLFLYFVFLVKKIQHFLQQNFNKLVTNKRQETRDRRKVPLLKLFFFKKNSYLYILFFILRTYYFFTFLTKRRRRKRAVSRISYTLLVKKYTEDFKSIRSVLYPLFEQPFTFLTKSVSCLLKQKKDKTSKRFLFC